MQTLPSNLVIAGLGPFAELLGIAIVVDSSHMHLTNVDESVAAHGPAVGSVMVTQAVATFTGAEDLTNAMHELSSNLRLS